MTRHLPSWAHLRRAAALTCAAVLVGACSTLPTTGIPQAFDSDVPSPSAVDFVAGAPTKGASPQAVIEGFLRACSAGPSDNFDTARLFLTYDSALRWNPEAIIQVYATDATPQISTEKNDAEHTVFVSAPAIATVDAAGTLTEALSSHTIRSQFRVVEEDGEWRIDAPEDGIIISAASFNAAYQLSHVFFPMRSEDTLASEAHWYPKKRLARHLMDALLRGPSESLAPAVASAIPFDAVLPPNGVEVEDGSATVTLFASMPAAEKDQRLLAWQIFQTLRQSAQVFDVSVQINGQPLSFTNLPSGPKYRLESAIAMGPEGVGLVSSGEFTPLPAYVPPTADLPLTSPPDLGLERWDGYPTPPATSLLAMSPINSAVLAWVGEGQLVALDRATKQHVQVPAPAASWPSVDRHGWAWSVVQGSTLVVVHPSGATSKLSGAPTMPGAMSIRISPDGSRAAVMRRVGSQVGVWVATVQRDDLGTPVDLLFPVALAKLSTNVRDVSWASSTALVALQGEGAESEVVTAPLGGLSQGIAAPDGAAFLTGGVSALDVYVTDTKGGVWSRSNSLWQPIEADVLSLRFPG